MAGDETQPGVFVLACLAQKAKNYELATRGWERYVLVRPNDPRGHYNLGVCLDALGEASSALGSFETAFGLQPDMADAGANAAGLCIRRGEAERACTLCYLALEGDPDCAPALYNLNTALRMAGREKEAVAFSWRWIRGKTSIGTAPGAIAAANYRETATSAPAPASSANINRNDNSSNITPPAMAAGTRGFHGPTSIPNSGAIDSCGAIPAVAGCCTTSSGRDQGGASGGAAFLTVVCVRWGDKYGPEYVERLAWGVRRNLRRSYNFICFTDDVLALDGMTRVVARPIGARCEGWKGWWHKAFLFSREAGLEGRVLYFDLDTVIVGPLDDIAGYVEPFAALSVAEMANEHRSEGLNSSLMSWDADSAEAVCFVYELLQEAYSVVTACVHKFDHWLEMTLPIVETLQKAFPGQVVEYKADCCVGTADNGDKAPLGAQPSASFLPVSSGWSSAPGGTERNVDEMGASYRTEMLPDADALGGEGLLPPNSRVVCFPLTPKPHEVRDGWVRRHWWGEEGRRSEAHTTG